MKAYCDRVNLTAQGFYKTPDLSFDWDNASNGGRIYNYYTYGVGCSEVELDTLTGDFKVNHTHYTLTTPIFSSYVRSLEPIC